MSAVVNPNWRVLQDTLAEVPGVMVPQSHPTPFWTEQLLTPEEADAIYFNVMAQYTRKELSRVYRLDGLGDEVNTDSRYTHYYDMLSLPNSADIEARFNAAVARASKAWWDSETAPVYPPQILGYEERCHFRVHCDNSIWQNGAWDRNDPLRDVTALLYISECVPNTTRPNQYSGGELVLENIQMRDGSPARIRPRKGQFVMFPSHPIYRHQVTPIINGYRIAIVNWWTLHGNKEKQ